MSQDPVTVLAPKKIGIIIGSTRPNRIGPQVATLIQSILSTSPVTPPTPAPTLTLIDIAAFNLPLFNETILPAQVPAQGQFEHQHSKDWSAEIGKYDAYVFVTAEWNSGIPGSMKNAIDYLYHTWIGKPAFIVSYGIMGGSSANDSLKAILTGMHLRVVETRVQLTFPDADPAQHMMSPGLIGAFGGKLVEPVAEQWKKEKSEEVLKGYGELLEALA